MDSVTDLTERLRKWAARGKLLQPYDVKPLLPGLATTIETLTQENARLKEAMKQALNAPMIDHNDSSRSVYGILRKALGGGDEQ